MTLSEQLRAAAVKRAQSSGDIVGDQLIDENGVLDLRVPPTVTTNATSTKALRETEGQVDTVTPAINEMRERVSGTSSHRWAHRLRRTKVADDHDEVIDLRSRLEPAAPTLPAAENPAVPLLSTSHSERLDTADDGSAHLGKGVCPKCGALGRHDHLDLFLKIVYRSCPNCFFMWQERQGQ